MPVVCMCVRILSRNYKPNSYETISVINRHLTVKVCRKFILIYRATMCFDSIKKKFDFLSKNLDILFSNYLPFFRSEVFL